MMEQRQQHLTAAAAAVAAREALSRDCISPPRLSEFLGSGE